MSELTAVTIDFAGFRASATHRDGVIAVRLLGSADSRHASALAAFLPNVHADMLRLKAKEAHVDIRQLEFMNSGCFKAFVTWLIRVQEMPSASYRIRFAANRQKSWQARTLGALRNLAVDMVVVEQ